MKALLLALVGFFALNTAVIADDTTTNAHPGGTTDTAATAPADTAGKTDEHKDHNKKPMKKKAKKASKKDATTGEEAPKEGM